MYGFKDIGERLLEQVGGDAGIGNAHHQGEALGHNSEAGRADGGVGGEQLQEGVLIYPA